MLVQESFIPPNQCPFSPTSCLQRAAQALGYSSPLLVQTGRWRRLHTHEDRLTPRVGRRGFLIWAEQQAAMAATTKRTRGAFLFMDASVGDDDDAVVSPRCSLPPSTTTPPQALRLLSRRRESRALMKHFNLHY